MAHHLNQVFFFRLFKVGLRCTPIHQMSICSSVVWQRSLKMKLFSAQLLPPSSQSSLMSWSTPTASFTTILTKAFPLHLVRIDCVYQRFFVFLVYFKPKCIAQISEIQKVSLVRILCDNIAMVRWRPSSLTFSACQTSIMGFLFGISYIFLNFI